MNVFRNINETVKRTLRSWLDVQPASPYAISIQELTDWETHSIRNRIWLRGDGNELSQLYTQMQEYADKNKFWASRSSYGLEMRKIHTGLPALIVRTLTTITLSDLLGIDIDNEAAAEVWEKIADENKLPDLLTAATQDALAIGDGAFKISIDTDLSPVPIIEWIPGERIEIIRKKGRLHEVIFKTEIVYNYQRFTLDERYGFGYIKNELYTNTGAPAALDSTPETAALQDVEFDESLILAVPYQVFQSAKWPGRGGSVYDGRLDSFDSFDEVYSQWLDALRHGRTNVYIPDILIPRDPDTGEAIRPNAFDNRYIATSSDMGEGSKNTITVVSPEIPSDQYVQAYITSLDLCLQGLISPSTLGIDVKKLDNAEAQREKEKATLYTRAAIISALTGVIQSLVSCSVNAFRLLHNEQPEHIESFVHFGEYASPSFEAAVETVAKAKTAGVMSTRAALDELYGTTKDDEWKEAEVERIKQDQGMVEVLDPLTFVPKEGETL